MIAAVLLLLSITTTIQADKACLEDPKEYRPSLLAFLATIMDISLLDPLKLPKTSPKDINTTFQLFKRETGEKPQVIPAANVSAVKDTRFDPSKKTVFITHGFNTNSEEWAMGACKAILAVHDVNCFCADWRAGAAGMYPVAIYNAPVVAAAMACFVRTIQEVYGSYSGALVHFIGHSLGAHICGMAARIYYQTTQDTVEIVILLDPAGPLIGENSKIRARPTDAKCVDAIYTNSDSFVKNLATSGYGTTKVCAKRNYHPNGGKEQPGCPQNIFQSAVERMMKDRSCNHAFAYWLFIASLVQPFLAYPAANYQSFQEGAGFPCSNGSCVLMGYNATCTPSNEITFHYFNTDKGPGYLLWRVRVTVFKTVPANTKGDITINFHNDTEEYKVTSGDLHNDPAVALLDVQKKEPPANVTVIINTSVPSGVKISRVTVQYGHDNQTCNYCMQNPEVGGDSHTLPRCG